MLKLSNLRLTAQRDGAGLLQAAAGMLGIPETGIVDLSIYRLSIDARRKPDVRFVHTLLVAVSGEQYEQEILSKKLPDVSLYIPPERYEFPSICKTAPKRPPIIAGTGPAGLFSALCLAEAGVKCVILERGRPVGERIADVERFMRRGGLDVNSNVQFGEGGAGTFSDGKLTTGIKDVRIRFVLELLVQFGAPEDILYLSKPHIGTNKLRGIVEKIRERLIELGCDIRFGHTLTDIDISGGMLRGITVGSGGTSYSMPADALILAPGNSARDTFEMLAKRGVRLSPKDFSVGVRIEHLQRDIDFSQYGHASKTVDAKLPASDYKLAAHLENGRTVYTFCVCPGGQVVASASEHGGIATNGMSRYERDGENCNGALLVTVTPDDFGFGPLDGVAFQRRLERSAFVAGGGDYNAPAQLVGDFLEKRASSGQTKTTPTYMPGVRFCNLWDVLPRFICESIHAALPVFSGRMTGFSDSGAVLTAIETRSSCPVRIEREDFETVGIRGIFPCGEGSGYAGGIISSAVDGIKCAERAATR